MLTVDYKNLKFNLPTADTCFSKKIGNYVEEIPRAIKLLSLRHKPKGTLVVIGACFGATVIGGLSTGYFDRVIAFEPDAYNVKLLETNLIANGMSSRVTIINKAVGAVPGKYSMTRCSPANIGGHLVHQNAPTEGDSCVEVVRLDDTLKELGIQDVGMVWCDAQGSEPYVLMGADVVLGGDIPWGIELAPGLMRSTASSVYIDHLQKFNTIYDMRTNITYDIRCLRDLYDKYFETKSPNNPNKSWHTQLFLY